MPSLFSSLAAGYDGTSAVRRTILIERLHNFEYFVISGTKYIIRTTFQMLERKTIGNELQFTGFQYSGIFGFPY